MARKKLRTGVNEAGYRVFWEDGRWYATHRRVMEKKLGGPIPAGVHVHHINRNKTDNRPENLTLVTPEVHGRLHGDAGRDCCFQCGRLSHWVGNCYAKTDFLGQPLG